MMMVWNVFSSLVAFLAIHERYTYIKSIQNIFLLMFSSFIGTAKEQRSLAISCVVILLLKKLFSFSRVFSNPSHSSRLVWFLISREGGINWIS